MQFNFLSFVHNYLFNKSYDLLNKSYQASKKIRDLQKYYLAYTSSKSFQPYKKSAENAAFYMQASINKLQSQIYWSLLIFKITRYFYSLSKDICNFLKKEKYSISYDELYHKNLPVNYNTHLNKKLAWIEAVLLDLEFMKSSSEKQGKIRMSWINYIKFPSGGITYDTIGLIPRSIIRTIIRFIDELRGKSIVIAISEFKLAKYQTIVSIQYLICLIFLPWITTTFSRNVLFEPLVETLWNTSQSNLFLSSSQEERALRELKSLKDLLWLDAIITPETINIDNEFIYGFQKVSIQIAEKYTNESIDLLVHPFTDLILMFTLRLLLTKGHKNFSILNSWAQELFHSLSDTMKAFWILFVSDLCLGFHSRHGWEMLIHFLLEHFGIFNAKYCASLLTCIAPVILHALFKYWVFRQLSRISPSIVANYDAMNE